MIENNYIDIQEVNRALDTAFEWHDPWDKVYTLLYLNGLPRVDVKPVIHAHWRVVGYTDFRDASGDVIDTEHHCACSHCGALWDFYWSEKKFDYCFHCGAQMDQEEE